MLKEKLGRYIDYLEKANIYTAKNEDTIEERRNQIISTRIFILLFFTSLIGLVGYASLTLRLTNVQIENPSQSTFEKLYSLYSETLVCPCSQTSIQMDKFVHVYVSYHQICSSIFVNDEWILSISHLIPNIFYSLDIRRVISSQLQLIASQCRSSETVVRNTLKNLGSNQLFIPTMISRDLMNSQVDKTVNEVKNDAVAQQKQSRNLIQTVHQQNQIVSALTSHFLYRNIDDSHQGFYLVKYLKDWTYPPTIGFTDYTDSQLCYCIDSSNCTYPSGIYPNLTGFDSYRYYGSMIPPMISSTQISGLHIGCTSFDSIMESTLQCFYDNNCLLELFNKTNAKPLNSSSNTIDTKIRTLMEELFVESWSSEKDFVSFFKECQPKKCTYSYNSRGNVGFVISVILSLIGGLFVALKVASSLSVISYKKTRHKIMIQRSQASLSNKNNQDDSSASNERVSDGRKMFDTIRKWISNFNLFEHAYNDAYGRRTEIITTRIYSISMFIGLMVIIFYASLVEYSVTYRIESPSLNTYRKLVDQYPSLTCECEEITAPYSIFISVLPRFHQICSSLYALDIFTLHLENRDDLIVMRLLHIGSAEGSYFNTIRVLCSFAKEKAAQLIETFLQTIYISNHLTHEVEFISIINASIENFKALAPPASIHLIQLIQDIAQGNQLLTGSFSNAKLQYNISSTIEDDKIQILWINRFNESCSCGMSLDSCEMLYDEYCNHTYSYTGADLCDAPVPGMHIACYIMNSMLLTSLECFYDAECVSHIAWLIQNRLHINIDSIPQSSYLLDKNITSRFYTNSTAFDIIREIGIEDWNDNIKYELYYNKCNPISCLYTITTKLNIPTVITTIIGLIGGLSVILRIVIPPIITFLRKRRRVQIVHVEIPVHESWNYRLIKNIREMNVFKSVETDQSLENRYNQIVSTRLYIILIVISVIVLTIYTGLSEKQSAVHVDFPSMSVVNQLQLENLNEFSCSCSKTTILFGTFTSLNFIFHQICSSDFVSNRWLEGLFNYTSGHSVHRAVLSAHFKLLQSFCQSSNKTLIYSIDNFYANQFLSVKLLTQHQFTNQIESSIKDFQTKTISSFQRNLASVIDITLGNQLMSAYETNWYFIPDPDGNYPIYTKSRSYRNCSCGSSQSLYCIDQLFINDNTTVTGMFIGCLPITSLRLSSFQCFYDQICLDEVKEALGLKNLSMISLDPSQLSQFAMNTTLAPIIDNLMLEGWTNKINYTEYFNQCNLQQCNYSITKRQNPLVILTTLLGLYGGLATTLRFIAPTIVQVVQKIRNKCRLNR